MMLNCLILRSEGLTFVYMTEARLVGGHWEEFGIEPFKAMVPFSKAGAVGVGVRKSQHPLRFLHSLSWGLVECCRRPQESCL